MENQDKRVLVVDDDPASVKIVQSSLEWEGYQVNVAESGEQALEKMQGWKPHLVLLDVSMPGIDGLQTLARLRKEEAYVSVLFLSGKSDTQDVIRGLDAGADDYICKPFDALELLSRVRAQFRIKLLHDSLSQANRRLKELVDIDDLTGLFNMRSIYQRLDNEIDRARRYDRGVCVIMMDMDHFKSVNDGHDHLFGSFVLSEVGGLIRNQLRKIDFGARYGGDEFLMVLTEIDLKGAQIFAERLRKSVEEYVFESEGHQKKLTVSVGFALAHPSKLDVDARILVRQADRALYKSKERGRNCVSSFEFGKDKLEDGGEAPEVDRWAPIQKAQN